MHALEMLALEMAERSGRGYGEPRVKRILLSWSSGKDSVWALHLLRQNPECRVEALVTTFNSAADRVAMHAVRRALVEEQARAVGLPLWQVELPWPCSNVQYEEIMRGVCQRAVAEGITDIAFGDLYLEDIRAYRERQLEGSGLKPLFPVWKIPTRLLAAHMITAGIRAKITCVDSSKLDRSYAGREYGHEFVDSLPATADPCGENGEFHTFVYEAPVFAHPIAVETGEIVERDGFIFADVLPA
jgi:uncharacterized protein (TIGR00290 family)